MAAKEEASLGSAWNDKGDSYGAMNAAQKTTTVDEPQEQEEAGVEVNTTVIDDISLWEEELAVRREVFNSPMSGNFLVAIWIHLYSAMHIFVVYLVSLEMLLSIGLSVGMTICKLELFWAGPGGERTRPLNGKMHMFSLNIAFSHLPLFVETGYIRCVR